MNLTNADKTNATSCCGPTCCGGESRTAAPAVSTADVTIEVKKRYGQSATSGLSSKQQSVRAVAEAFGYTADELASIPAEANMGLSCGNPTATANLRPGEVVVDLGSGGGLDIFLAAEKVGPTGKAIGIDMTPEMIALARKNAAASGLTNVEFHLATIDTLPLADASVDVVISNCVINLAPDKDAVFREIARILKPGGRLAVSDIALKKPLPPEMQKNVEAYVGCIAGALEIDDFRNRLAAAGLNDVLIVDTHADLNAYGAIEGQSACCSPASPSASEGACCGTTKEPSVHGGLAVLLDRYNLNDYAASVKAYAVKPA